VAAATKANDAAAEAGQAVAVAEPYLQGLWYPIIIGAICFIIGAIYVDGKSTSHKH
jgi:1,4-dihydroxy-2-naphthoate octaprenyltransferase